MRGVTRNWRSGDGRHSWRAPPSEMMNELVGEAVSEVVDEVAEEVVQTTLRMVWSEVGAVLELSSPAPIGAPRASGGIGRRASLRC